jgi:penicillin-binding protein 2
MLHAVRNPLTGVVINADPQPEPSVDAPTADFKQVISDMLNVTQSPRGTAHRISYGAKYKIAGKTGTAQVYSLSQNDEETDESNVPEALRDHALFIAFAPVKEPQIAVAVIVEHGGGGGSVAAPVARAVMDAYFSEGLPR